MKWTEFVKRYPNYEKHRFFNEGGDVKFLFNGDYYDPFNPDGSLKKTFYHFAGDSWNPENINDFLGSTFPKSLMLTNKKYPIPAVDVDFDKVGDIRKLLSPLEIYITSDKKISIKINDIFQLTPPSIQSTTGYLSWMQEPNMKYWSQQLNFATWCATSGCGIGYDMLEPDTQVALLLRFHVLLTIRRILNSLQVPLPWDNTFVWNGTRYNKGALLRLCNEFEIKNPDFRFKGQSTDSDKFNFHYVSPNKDSLTAYYTSTHKDRSQYNWFIPQKSEGITKAGLSRLNQSIESFVYCILGAQVNTRSPILGNDGSAQETLGEFIKLFESSIIEHDISKSIQRYQFAIQQAKVRLNLAISPGTWLLPSNLVINTQSVSGYNNKLQRATKDMKFGVNNINNDIVKIIKHNIGRSKIKLPHQVEKLDKINKPSIPDKPILKPIKSSQKHDSNLTLVTVGAAGLAWYLFR